MISRLLDFLFGRCSHRRVGIVVTNRVTHKSTVMCQSCGARISFDWKGMRQGEVQVERPTMLRHWEGES